MANQNIRVLGRIGARELTTEEVEKISGARVPTNTTQFTHLNGRFDMFPDFDA